MPSGVERSLTCLTQSTNAAAIDTLLAAVDHAPESIRYRALLALLNRRHSIANQEIIRRWPQYPAAWHEPLREQFSRLETALQAAAVSSDQPLHEAAGEAAVSLRYYDLIAQLLETLEARRVAGSKVGASIVQLAALLHEELSAPRDYSRRRDPKLVRRFVLSVLEASVERFPKHRCEEPLEAYLILAGHENASLRASLQSGRGEVYEALIRIFRQSQHKSVVHLLLNFLDDTHTPAPLLNIIAQRHDESLMEAMLEKMQRDHHPEFARNLMRMKRLPWADASNLKLFWPQLSDIQQQAAARLIMRSGMPLERKQAAMVSLLELGHPGARRLATASLAEFSGGEMNALVEKLLNDHDPQVQACALVQLRQRNIPGAIATLVRRLESPESAIRNAARSCLQEFTFSRFLSAFEEMKPEVRRSTGALVKKVDPQAIPAVIEELGNANRLYRIRAVEMAALLGPDPRLEDALVDSLADTDHLVRAEVARKLVKFGSAITVSALRNALTDQSVTVQDAARQSLDQLEGTQVRDEKSTVQWAELLEAGMRVSP